MQSYLALGYNIYSDRSGASTPLSTLSSTNLGGFTMPENDSTSKPHGLLNGYAGKPFTYQGTPCKRGHVGSDGKTSRLTTTGHCVSCKREISNTPEARKRRVEYQKLYRETPEAKEARSTYMKLYNQRPEMRCKRQTYESAYRKVYVETPHVKARKKEYLKAYDLYRKYGLSMADFNAIFLDQSGLCCVCSCELHKPYVDHDHKTGKVRGILCGKCNLGLGSFMDNPELCIRAAAYLQESMKRAGRP